MRDRLTRSVSLRRMPISAEHVGRQYPPTPPYEVSAAKIHEFARAVGDDNPAYWGPAPAAPPTFLAVVAASAWDQMFADQELGLALNRIVHGDQSFAYDRPLRAGDVITATLTIDKVRVRGQADIVTTSVAVSTADQEPICRATSTFFHTRQQDAS